MREAVFRFHGELNDFLPTNRRENAFPHRFLLPASIKDMIEALGVQHTEVDIILVNEGPVDFGICCRTATASAFTPLPPRSTYLLPFRCGRNCRNFVLFWTPISVGWRRTSGCWAS